MLQNLFYISLTLFEIFKDKPCFLCIQTVELKDQYIKIGFALPTASRKIIKIPTNPV